MHGRRRGCRCDAGHRVARSGARGPHGVRSSTPRPSASGGAERAPASVAPVVTFFALACAISWAWWLPLAAQDHLVARGDGWPTHVPGLLGPMLAAGVVISRTEGRAAVRRWLRAMTRWPRQWRWQLATLAPVGFLAIGIGLLAVTSGVPPVERFTWFSGTGPGLGALGVVLVGALGEEAGWRGYALPRLQARLGATRASLLIAAGWAFWHLPLFAVLASYQGFGLLVVPGFVVGLTAGALVLTAIYNGTGGSVLAAAVWHGSYNLAAATDATDGTVAALTTALVIAWAVAIIRGSGRPPHTARDRAAPIGSTS
jgi:uncharacterized protein